MNAQTSSRALLETEEQILFSANVGQNYHLFVALPEDYATSNQSYPVVYLLDGNVMFGMAAGLTPGLHWSREAPELIVVGIGYDVKSFAEWGRQREREYKMPDVRDAPPDSYADRFLAALTQEIVPFIDANYRTVPSDRSLYGYSSSGFFVLYALFQQPGAFRRYLAGSGSLYLAVPYLIERGEHLLGRQTADPIQLYLSVGELEDFQFPFFDTLVAYLGDGQVPGLTLITEVFPGERHSSEGVALTYLHGLREVYKAG